MDIPYQLGCLVFVQIEERDGPYEVKIPEQEVRLGEVDFGEIHRVTILPSPSTTGRDEPPPAERQLVDTSYCTSF
jgi:hypothetical protein